MVMSVLPFERIDMVARYQPTVWKEVLFLAVIDGCTLTGCYRCCWLQVVHSSFLTIVPPYSLSLWVSSSSSSFPSFIHPSLPYTIISTYLISQLPPTLPPFAMAMLVSSRRIVRKLFRLANNQPQHVSAHVSLNTTFPWAISFWYALN